MRTCIRPENVTIMSIFTLWKEYRDNYTEDVGAVRGSNKIMDSFEHVLIKYSTRKSSGRTLFGVGINNAPYRVRVRVGGKRTWCPYHRVWSNMLKYCYSKYYQSRHKYINENTVCDEWLYFTEFRKWISKQPDNKLRLVTNLFDRDNLVFSPDTCIFVSQEVSVLIAMDPLKENGLPVGITRRNCTGGYIAEHMHNRVSTYLGCHSALEDAYNAYRRHKYSVIREVALKQPVKIKRALLAYKLLTYAEWVSRMANKHKIYHIKHG